MESPNKTLLSIDGGGLYGIGVANWVPKLGDQVFDYYAGTSVGSILAACYAIGMTPEEVQKKFNGDLPKKIFKKTGINPLRPAIYTNGEAQKVFEEIFEDRQIKDTKHPLIVVAWNFEKRKEKVFTHKFNNSYRLSDAVLASISAPTYFPVLKLKNEKGHLEQLGDGGVCGNDPSLAGISAMRDDGVQTRHIRCLSI